MPRTSTTLSNQNLKNIVVFASGSGSNFQSIIDAISSGFLEATITGLITDRGDIQSLERARFHNIPYFILPPKSFNDQESYDIELAKTLKSCNADILVLAGYLKKIPDSIIDTYRDHILNIHPSLLPKYGGKGFYGMKVHQAVIENGDSESGCTVHLVNEIYDDGPVLGQVKVPVLPTDSPSELAKRVLAEEHKLYPQVISEFLKTLS